MIGGHSVTIELALDLNFGNVGVGLWDVSLQMKPDQRSIFSYYSDVADDDVDLVRALLDFSSLWHDGVSLQSYSHHMEMLARETEKRFQVLVDAGGEDRAGTRLAALHDTIMLENGYAAVATQEDFDPLIHADLVEVIKARRGAAIVVCAIFAGVGRLLGWQVGGLDLAGYFIGRIDCGGERLMFDLAQGCRLLQAHDLRHILKGRLGDSAELSSLFYEPINARSWVLRAQNLIKLHQIRIEDYHAALKTVEAMRVFAPAEYRLLFDAGVLYARTYQREPAIFALEHYIEKAPDRRSRQEATFLLQEIKDIFE